jgi:hypothetical protein
MSRLLSCTEDGTNMNQDEMYRHLDGNLWWIYDGDQEEQVRDACMLFERAEFAAAQNAPAPRKRRTCSHESIRREDHTASLLSDVGILMCQ